MSIATGTPPITMEQLLASENRGRFELVNGEMEEVQMSNISSFSILKIAAVLLAFCERNNLGLVLESSGYFRCFGVDQENARKPDVSFISKARLPADWMNQSYFTIPPDLAVEVLSPNDLAYKVDVKIEEYFAGGVQLIWIVNPEARQVLIHRPDGSAQKLHENDTITGEGILPGFTCVVREFFLPRS